MGDPVLSRLARLAAYTLLAGCAGAFVSCSGTETGFPSSAANAPEPAAAEAPADFDQLSLVLKRTRNEPFELGRAAGLEMVLVNRSHDQTFPVVLPGDGSDAGWREPHVFYTVERRTDSDAWEPVPRERSMRCGNYDEDWVKDVVSLPPGQELPLPYATHVFRDASWKLEGVTRIRVTAHYAYGNHELQRGPARVPPSLAAMPAYELVSNAIELAIDPQMVLELEFNGKLPGANEPLASAAKITAVNRGHASLPFARADAGAYVSLEVEGDESDGQSGSYEIEATRLPDRERVMEWIAPGERKNVLGAARVSEFVQPPPPGFHPRRVRAVLLIDAPTDENPDHYERRVAESPWVPLR